MDKFFTGIDTKGVVKFNPELLAINEYTVIWNRDKSNNKVTALKELTFIWCMCCREEDNQYKDYPKLERVSVLTEDIFNKGWKPDKLLQEAIMKYSERHPKSRAERSKEATEKALDNIEEYLSTVDVQATDDYGKLVNPPDKVQAVIGKMPDTLIRIRDIAEIIKEENETSKIKGGGDVSYFEEQ